jgi:hypothetical protein
MKFTITNDPTADHDTTINIETTSQLIPILENRWSWEYGPMVIDTKDGEIEVENATELVANLEKYGKVNIDFEDCYAHATLEK